MQRGWVISPDYRAAIEAIKAARISADISQRELARRLEKPPSFINKIELLERRLDILEFIAVARALGSDPVELLERVLSEIPAQLSL